MRPQQLPAVGPPHEDLREAGGRGREGDEEKEGWQAINQRAHPWDSSSEQPHELLHEAGGSWGWGN